MTKPFYDKVFISLWLIMVCVCGFILFQALSQENKPYNAGLLAALDINIAENQAAIALSQNYQNKLLLLVGHKELSKAISLADDINEQLNHTPWLESAYSNPMQSKQLKQLIDYYGQSPFSYLTVKQQDRLAEALQSSNSQPLTESYFSLLNQWADPIVSESIVQDSTLTLASFLKERLSMQSSSETKWQLSQQSLMLKGGELNYIPVFISVLPEFTNIRDSVVIYQTLQQISEDNSYFSSDNILESEVIMTGMLLHSASASIQAQGEISSFGVFSLVCVMLLVLVTFRTFSPLVACFSVMASAVLVGFVALILWFNTIHLLALVFAVSILGIAVDYGFHVLVLAHKTNESAQHIRRKVFLPLTIALVSSITGYSLFFTTPISLLHQVVVFVSFGLIGAYVTALFLLPTIRFKSKGLSFSYLPKQRFSYLAIAGFSFLISLTLLNFDDSIANLNTKSDALVKQELRVVELTGESLYPYMVLVSAEDKQALLTKTLTLTNSLRADGAQLKSISDWQLPITVQQNNIELIKANWQANNYQDIKPYLEISDVGVLLENAKPIASTPRFISQSQGLDIKHVAGKYWTGLLLQQPLSALQKQITERISGASYVNLPASLSEQLTAVRLNIIDVALPALVVILIILASFFGFKSAVIMLLVPTISSGISLFLSQLIQGSLNVFNVLACLLIITLAIDYMVFFRSHGVTKLISHTISLSALSSALTFGVMAFSATPAVSGFGLTLLVGIVLAWLLSHLTPLPLAPLTDTNNKLKTEQ